MKIFLETKILMPRFLNVCYRRNKISPECKWNSWHDISWAILRLEPVESVQN
jgi:hypothetical protein